MFIYILRITFKTIKSYNNLQKNIKILIKKKKFKKILIKGFYKIKNKNKIFTLLKSPHIFKKSREHFIYKNFINKIDIQFNNIIILLNCIIFINKLFINNKMINIKIIKKYL